MIGVEYINWGSSGSSTKILTKPPPSQNVTRKEKRDTLPTVDTVEKGAPGPVTTALNRKTTHGSTVKCSGSVYTWRDVNYSVGTGAGEKQLLHGINGYVKPGRLTALMGPSGAGKTTLLDNLALRKRVGTVSGEFLMDGKRLMPDFERSTAFVEQQDVHDGMI